MYLPNKRAHTLVRGIISQPALTKSTAPMGMPVNKYLMKDLINACQYTQYHHLYQINLHLM